MLALKPRKYITLIKARFDNTHNYLETYFQNIMIISWQR